MSLLNGNVISCTKIAAFLFNTSVELHVSLPDCRITTFSCYNSMPHHWWTSIWTRSCLLS